MSKNKNDEPRDEFDRIQIPEFLARPFERLGSRPAARPPLGRPDDARTPDDQRQPASSGDPDADTPDETPPAPRAWWSGYKGKLLLYGAGTLVMVFLQSRG